MGLETSKSSVFAYPENLGSLIETSGSPREMSSDTRNVLSLAVENPGGEAGNTPQNPVSLPRTLLHDTPHTCCSGHFL